MPCPYSRMNVWTIEASVVPAACICAIRSLAGLEKWHSNMEQVATESGQPHLQAMRAPTRRTSTLGFCDAVCARAAVASTAKSMLFRNRCMLPSNAHHFGAGVLHLHLARDEADERAANQHEPP